jgi:hypothetical protein
VRRAERLEDRKPSFAQMERTRDSVQVNRLLEVVEEQRDAWVHGGVWEDIPESGCGICEEEEGRAVVGGIVHQVLMCLVGEERETDLCAEAGEFNPIAAGSSPRQRMIRVLYALRGGAQGFSVLMLLFAVARVAMYPLTVFSVYLDEGRRHFVNHPLFAFVLPSDTGKSLLARVMEGAFCLHLDMPPTYPNGVGPAEAVARRNITYKARSAVRTRLTTGTWEGVRDGLDGSFCGGENSKKSGTLILNAEGDSMVRLLPVNPNFNDTLLKIGSSDVETVVYASGTKAVMVYWMQRLRYSRDLTPFYSIWVTSPTTPSGRKS